MREGEWIKTIKDWGSKNESERKIDNEIEREKKREKEMLKEREKKKRWWKREREKKRYWKRERKRDAEREREKKRDDEREREKKRCWKREWEKKKRWWKRKRERKRKHEQVLSSEIGACAIPRWTGVVNLSGVGVENNCRLSKKSVTSNVEVAKCLKNCPKWFH